VIVDLFEVDVRSTGEFERVFERFDLMKNVVL